MRWEVGLGRCFRARGSGRIWVCSCGDPESCTQRTRGRKVGQLGLRIPLERMTGALLLDSHVHRSLRETHNTSGGPSSADPGEPLPVSPTPTLSPYNSGTPFPK